MDILREVLEEEEGFGEDTRIEALDSETYGTQHELLEPFSSGQPESFSISRKNSKRHKKKAAQPQPQPQPSSPSVPSISEDDAAANTEVGPQPAERPTDGAYESESGSDAAEADSLDALLQMRGRTDSRQPEQHDTETTVEGEMDALGPTSIGDVSHDLVGNLKLADTSGDPLRPAGACSDALSPALSTLMCPCRGRATRQSCTEEAEEEEERQSCTAGRARAGSASA